MSNNYFTKVVDDAIVRYRLSNCKKEKSDLFQKIIEPCFRQLIEKVVYAYNFTGLKNLSDLKDDCFISLINALEKFNPDFGSKAFSYFTVITKNWFVLKYKEQSKQIETMNQLSTLKSLEYNENQEEKYFKQEFFEAVRNDLDNWIGTNKKFNSIVFAIKEMLLDIDKLDFCNKGTIFFSLKEITGLKAPELTYLMKKINKKYLEFKTQWINERANQDGVN